MSRMSNNDYNDAKRHIQDRFQYGSGSKDEYVSYLKNIINSYDDGYECAKDLDHYQTNWSVFGYEIR